MNRLLKLLLAAAFFNALAWIIIIPVWQYPDEQAHFSQVQDIAEVGTVSPNTNTSQEIAISEEILGTQRDGAGNNKFTYHPEFKLNYSQNFYGPGEKEIVSLPKSSRTNFVKNEATQNPPLYYFLSAQIYKLAFPGSLLTRVFAVRIFSALLFLSTLLVAFACAKIIFPPKQNLPLIFTSFIAFTPMLVFSSTGVLPDPLTNLLFSLIIFFSLRTLNYGITKITTALTLIAIILGAMTRQQILITIPIALAPYLFHLLSSKKGILSASLTIIMVGLIVYLANTAGTAFPVINNLRIPDASSLNLTLISQKSFLEHIRWSMSHTYREVLPWYWGVYRWLSLTLPHPIYRVINLTVLLSLAGLILHFLKAVKTHKFEKTDQALAFLMFSLAIYFTSLTIWDYFFRMNNNFSFGIQGRYFLPLIIPQMAGIVVGLDEIARLISRKFARYSMFILATAMVLFSNYSLYFVANSYYDLSSVSTFIIQASQYKPPILKGSIIYLIILIALALQLIFLFSAGLATLKDKNESS